MIDTQEANLPNDEKIMLQETGKLEESQTPVNNPVETTTEMEVNPDIVIPKDTPVPKVEPEKEAETVDAETTDPEPEVALEAADPGLEVALEAADAEVEDSEIEDELVPILFDKEEESETIEPDDEIEALAPEVEFEENMAEPLSATALASITKLEIIERLRLINAEPKKYIRSEVDMLKQTYYKMFRIETEAKKKQFLEGGGEEKDFIAPEDETEAELRSLVAEIKEKRAILSVEEERQKETNLILKQHLIERLKILSESQDDFNKRYKEFRDIQRKWREIKIIPQDSAKELWRSYLLYNERFYDIVKINNQFRDYDFKKNLEMKTILCETVERLARENDVISSFHQLQKLHQQWREIGLVAKEYRESIWDRFRAASTMINRKHQSYFDDQKGQEEKNLEQKESICKELESIDLSKLRTMKDWEKKTDEVIALQAKWRSIGFASKRHNNKVFDRFRAASDNYFNKKSEFYKTIKKELDKNFELKRALVEKAEALKTSSDWKETTKAFVEIQNEWKKIGSVGRKHSDLIWKQFIDACDYFFERKNKETTAHKSEEHINLEAKRALIEKIRSIDKQLSEEEALSLLRGYLSEWNTIGFVPFKEKDRLQKSFREATDNQFERLKVSDRDRRVQQYRSNLKELVGGGKKMYNERDKLMRMYDRMKSELQTFENNIGFISSKSSKGGDGLLKEMDRKILRLKEEMEVIIKKIEAIDENL